MIISAINPINNQQQNINFQSKSKVLKNIGEKVKELPYTLGIKKKKTFWEKVKDFFSIGKNTKAKTQPKNTVTENVPKKDNTIQVLGKDFSRRIKDMDKVLFG
ncbi:hypothetical protein IJI31_06350 [bacterium]|nr:hypothetical protein [bacterium]